MVVNSSSAWVQVGASAGTGDADGSATAGSSDGDATRRRVGTATCIMVGRRSATKTPRPGGIGVPGRMGALTPVVWKNSIGSSGWRYSARRALRISLSIGFMEKPAMLRVSTVATMRMPSDRSKPLEHRREGRIVERVEVVDDQEARPGSRAATRRWWRARRAPAPSRRPCRTRCWTGPAPRPAGCQAVPDAHTSTPAACQPGGDERQRR